MTVPWPHMGATPRALAGRALKLAAWVGLRDATREPADSAEHVRQAWLELKEHPALTWVPPLWRPDDDSPAALEAARRHRISALQRNLRVDVVPSEVGVRVRLVTGPLTDRRTPLGIDPLQPAVVSSDLIAEGHTFEDAVLALRDAVRTRYPVREASDR